MKKREKVKAKEKAKAKAKEKPPPDQVKITKIVREIICGRPIYQIPYQLLPRIHIELSGAKQRAIKDGLINRVQKIQKAMLDVEQYQEERDKLNSAKKRSKSSFLRREDNFDEDDENFDPYEVYIPPPTAVLDSILDDLKDGIPFEIAETRDIPYLIDRSKDIIDSYLQIGDYFTAQKYEDVHVQLVSLIEERKREKRIENKLNYLTNLLNENQTKLNEIKDEKRQKLEEHDEKVADSLTKSRLEYEQANREYDEITNGPLPVSARKYSSAYLNTREKERFLIQSRRYEEAAAVKAEADQMEEKELHILWSEFVEKREKKKKVIEEKQSKALKCIIENGDRTRLRIINEYDQKIQEVQRTVDNIQSRIKLVDINAVIPDSQGKDQSGQKSIQNQEYSNIKKNNSKIAFPIIPRETTTSKMRSSPFVTQATPQITSPDKLNGQKAKTQNKFLIKKDNKNGRPNMTSKLVSGSPQKNSENKSSITFSSNSFISSDDEQKSDRENDEHEKSGNDSDIKKQKSANDSYTNDSDGEIQKSGNDSILHQKSDDDNRTIDDEDFIIDDNDNDDADESLAQAEFRKNTAPIGKNMIQKKRKSDVTQPNSQLARNRKNANNEVRKQFSMQRKFSTPPKRSKSQIREQLPSPHLYNPNFKAIKKKENTENLIRVAKTSSKK